jgi:hypothetical protein
VFWGGAPTLFTGCKSARGLGRALGRALYLKPWSTIMSSGLTLAVFDVSVFRK